MHFGQLKPTKLSHERDWFISYVIDRRKLEIENISILKDTNTLHQPAHTAMYISSGSHSSTATTLVQAYSLIWLGIIFIESDFKRRKLEVYCTWITD